MIRGTMIYQCRLDVPSEYSTPEQRLWAAVVHQAWQDAHGEGAACGGGTLAAEIHEQAVKEAVLFFEDDTPGAWQHFERVCTFANLDPELVDVKYYDKKYNRTREVA